MENTSPFIIMTSAFFVKCYPYYRDNTRVNVLQKYFGILFFYNQNTQIHCNQLIFFFPQKQSSQCASQRTQSCSVVDIQNNNRIIYCTHLQ